MKFFKPGIIALLALSALALGGTSALACPPTLTPATGGEAISADKAGGAWTTLTGPTLTEGIAGEIGTGTIVLKAPAGFVFNTAAVVTAKLTGTSTASKNLNNLANGAKLPATVTSSTITISITACSTGSLLNSNSLTWQNIQVRPTAGKPLASGDITIAGTADIAELPCDATAGALREVAGALAGYKVTGSGTATAGTPVTVTIQKVDQFGNPLPDNTGKTLTVTGLGGTGAVTPLINNPSGSFGSGLPVTFNSAGTATVTFTPYTTQSGTINVTDGTVSSTAVSGGGLTITVNPAPASKLVFTSIPTGISYGSTFSASVRTVDQFGNPSVIGLGTTLNVSLSLSSGVGSIAGVTTANMGTGGFNGAATFSGLSITAAGNNQVIQATASGFTLGSATLSVARVVVTPSATVSSKTYDGTTAATIATRSLAGILGGDDVNLGSSGVANFSDKNVGSGKSVIVTGLGLSGAAAGNYQLSATSCSASASISARALTISATAATKPYDGTTGSASQPSISSGTLAVGDNANFTQAYGDKHVGTNKQLIPTGFVNDGNGGANYALTFVNGNVGTITARALTVTAATDSKVFDGSTSSTAAPSVTSGSLVAGDAAIFSQSFADKNAGTSKTIVPTGSVSDGNGGNNYSLSFVSVNTGTISPRSITVSAVTDSKVYDCTTASTGTPVLSVGALVSGDNLNFTQSFSDKNVGTGKTLIPVGSVNDGNGGNNYNVSLASVNTGVITARTLTVRADNQTRQYGTPCPTLTASYSGFAPGETMANCGLSGTPTLSTAANDSSLPGTYPITASPGTLTAANYNFNLIDGSLTVVPATGTSPGDISDGLSVWITQDNGTNYLAMKFKRNKNAAALGLQYLPQVSGDKQNWVSDIANILEMSVLHLDSQFDWVIVRDTTSITPAAPRFIQLKVLAN